MRNLKIKTLSFHPQQQYGNNQNQPLTEDNHFPPMSCYGVQNFK